MQEGTSFLVLMFGLSVASREVLAAGVTPRLLDTRQQHTKRCSLCTALYNLPFLIND